ncbi:GPP34 family phosphoprotein [Actinomadura madurae]|nr:GPP34 family phosphoprotein [Actinomadura madurae]URM94354.1 GPP34 family phosphoprotein [Actinomadura madurae]URN05057.1 GPP34 family phosphoprotein [Actinomadura madurae]
MTHVPETLPARMFLLAYDLRKRKMTSGGTRLGYVLRAAALTELFLDGRLVEERGRPVPGTPGDDPYGVLAQIAESRPRRWRHWVCKDAKGIVTTVREELVRDGWIRTRRRRMLGLFPYYEVTVKDPRVVKALWGGASSALRGRPVAHVNSYDAAAVALAAAGELKSVLPEPDRRRYRRRIEELTARTGPAPAAVRGLIREEEAAAAG